MSESRDALAAARQYLLDANVEATVGWGHLMDCAVFAEHVNNGCDCSPARYEAAVDNLISIARSNPPDGWVLARREDAEDGAALREWQDYAGALSDTLMTLGHHPAALHQSPDDYDSESGLACSIESCLAHFAAAARNTYVPQEESMPKKSPVVHTGRIVAAMATYDPETREREADITVRLDAPDQGTEIELGGEVVVALDWGSLQRSIGPSPEEQAVIDAALQWVQAIPGSIAAQRLVTAVQALKEAK